MKVRSLCRLTAVCRTRVEKDGVQFFSAGSLNILDEQFFTPLHNCHLIFCPTLRFVWKFQHASCMHFQSNESSFLLQISSVLCSYKSNHTFTLDSLDTKLFSRNLHRAFACNTVHFIFKLNNLPKQLDRIWTLLKTVFPIYVDWHFFLGKMKWRL